MCQTVVIVAPSLLSLDAGVSPPVPAQMSPGRGELLSNYQDLHFKQQLTAPALCTVQYSTVQYSTAGNFCSEYLTDSKL